MVNQLPAEHTSQYWFQHYLELRAILEQKGPPIFFWTFSVADNYWPELHNLMPNSPESSTHSARVQAVIDQPHLTDWYFSCRLVDFVQHWLYDILDCDWHWYRLEYQARGSVHAHGCAKLKNDPGICMLVQKAASGWLSAQHTQVPNSEQITKEGEEAQRLKCWSMWIGL